MSSFPNFQIIMVGAEGFEPPKSKDGRFTVCSRWPLVEYAPFLPFKISLFHIAGYLNFQNTGATCRNRTSDLLITNQLLYHLS